MVTKCEWETEPLAAIGRCFPSPELDVNLRPAEREARARSLLSSTDDGKEPDACVTLLGRGATVWL